MDNIFLYAVQNKLRFNYKGSLTTEDLFDLPVKALDDIYKCLKREEKASDEESLLATKNKNEVLEAKINIVKFIVNSKLEQARLNKERIEKAEKRKKIAEILAKREDEAMDNMSDDDLRKMLAELT